MLQRAPRRTVSALRFRAPASVRRLIVLAVLLAAAPQARASLMLAQPPYRPKDFAIVKKDGVFHVFYIRHDVTKPDPQTENDFGHAVSSDMYSWTQLPAVLPVREESWDNLHVWAPSIVERDSVYYMFYTGVTERPGEVGTEQRAGLATSTDLMNWNRLDDPIYSCRDVPWAWCDTLNNNNGFRDPFVMADPSVPGQWLMYYSGFPAADTAGMIIGVAASNGDFTHWNDLMPLWATNRQYSYNTLLESPHLFKHGDLWFLVFTSNAGQPLSYFVAFNPTSSIDHWFYRGRLSNMLGYDTRSWSASEYLKDGLNEYFAFANYNRVEIYKMMWTGTETFQLFEPGSFHIRSLAWDADSVAAGQHATLTVVATGWFGRDVELQAARKLPGGGEEPFPIDSVQIPALIPLTADTTRFEWTGTMFHPPGDTDTTLTFVVRTTDLTAAAGPLTVLPGTAPPPPLVVQSLSWSADSVASGDAVTLSVVASNWSGATVALEGVERVPPETENPVLLDSLGLPSSLALTADTTRFTWDARIWRASGDTTTALELEMRTPQNAIVAPLLEITSRPTPPPYTIDEILWSADSVAVGQPVTLSVRARSWSGQVAQLAAFERLGGGVEVTLDSDSLGLPAALPLVADTTRFAWSARIWRSSGDATTPLRLMVLNPMFGVESPELRIGVPPPPPPFKIESIHWSAESAEVGTSVVLFVAASGWSGHHLVLDALERLPGGGDSTLTIGDLGLPAELPIAADTTHISWVARIRRATGDLTTPQALVVRAPGQSVESQALTVEPQPLSGEPGDGTIDDRRLRFRMLGHSVFGERPSFLVDLPSAGHARLDIYDLQGRRVRTLADRDFPVGATVIAWDGRDAGGSVVGRGLYFARLAMPSGSRMVKVVLTRPVGAP